MKIKALAVAAAPDGYIFEGDTVTANYNGESLIYNLEDFPEDGRFIRAERMIGGLKPIYDAQRINGELFVTIVQKVIAGQYPGRKAHWRESPTIDAEDYDPDTCYVIPTGMVGVDDYEIVQGVDVAGNTGWTVRKKEMADG